MSDAPCGDGTITSLLSPYSPAFDFIAATKSMPDGSVHAGVVDIATGTFRDTSQSLHRNDFSSEVTTDKVLGINSDGTLYFDSDGRTYSATAPYNGTPVAARLITEDAPSGGRILSVADDSSTDATLLKLPAGTKNAYGDQRSDWSNDYAEFAGDPDIFSGCAQPRWISGTKLLCYSPGRLGVTNAAFTVLDLQRVRLTATHDESCVAGSFCYEKYVWFAPQSAFTDLLPENSRANSDFLPAPDGSSILFKSAQGDDCSLEIVALPHEGKAQAPSKLSLPGFTTASHIVPVAWK